MLPTHSRLSREDFITTFKGARRTRFPGIQVLYIPHPTLQVSVVVSKKVAPLAVRRNYLRRRTYAFFRDYTKNSPCTGRFIVMFLGEAKTLPITTILLSLQSSLATLLSLKSHSR